MRGFHHDHHHFRRNDNLERGRLSPTLRQHALNAGKAFFVVIGFNHDANALKEAGGARSEHRMAVC